MKSPLLSLPGAVPAEGVDEGVAAHYGDLFREQRALADGTGFVDLSHRGVITVSGEDRLSWLHLLLTQHVSDRYTERLPRIQETAAPVPQSTFEPHDLVDHAMVAAARAFDTTPETLIGADRTRATADARGVAMTAARMRGQSLPQIARHFDRDHTTVLHATRRIEKTPPLRDLAAKIAGELPDEPSEAGNNTRTAAGLETVGAVSSEPAGPRSPGAQHERRHTPASTADRHLQVAR